MQEKEARRTQEEEAVAASARVWSTLSPDEVHAAMRGDTAVIDVRSVREWDWGKIKGAVHCPVVLTTGSSLNPGTKPNPDFVKLVSHKFPDRTKAIVLYGSSTKESMARKGKSEGAFKSRVPTSEGEDLVALAMELIVAAGYGSVGELADGYVAWDLAYRPDGRRREKGNWADRSSGELEWWTASN